MSKAGSLWLTQHASEAEYVASVGRPSPTGSKAPSGSMLVVLDGQGDWSASATSLHRRLPIESRGMSTRPRGSRERRGWEGRTPGARALVAYDAAIPVTDGSDPVLYHLEAARAFLPTDRAADLDVGTGEIGTLDHYREFLAEVEYEMALYTLGRIGQSVAMPRRFWEHLVAAAVSAGLNEYAARYRTHLPTEA
jgi:hypothetical protein